MKKFIKIIVIIGIILAAAIFTRFYLGGDEDTWLCQNGQWVKHGQPGTSMPDLPCQ